MERQKRYGDREEEDQGEEEGLDISKFEYSETEITIPSGGPDAVLTDKLPTFQKAAVCIAQTEVTEPMAIRITEAANFASRLILSEDPSLKARSHMNYYRGHCKPIDGADDTNTKPFKSLGTPGSSVSDTRGRKRKKVEEWFKGYAYIEQKVKERKIEEVDRDITKHKERKEVSAPSHFFNINIVCSLSLIDDLSFH
ncbi:uncharacterized protein FOMMEDRAFT_161929 [Fomitiporia mediterranea MF3/22]|uniref:uncharacterized protein n=1 Tax=Fomitiporia mediterranea (strain MF3/22) TaxID=694068 RepID=UPI0004408CEE|nr:uncharacterized protein FOMMEDRAFT_161929 [Fomitiporia mediterranea MF3/22]EJC98176.1 hypothetical protein FOMMEDRAFT_161929 [Fomitiporia mediterranea MF3/22]